MIALRGITKTFGAVTANENIDLDIFASEIHALLGENGAGKSTLMKVLYGVYRPDAGEILSDDLNLKIRSPRDARDAGIGMVFQDLNLIPAFSVAENIALFLSDMKFVLNRAEIEQRILKISRSFGLEVEPDATVGDLSIGEKQKVELVKLLLSDALVRGPHYGASTQPKNTYGDYSPAARSAIKRSRSSVKRVSRSFRTPRCNRTKSFTTISIVERTRSWTWAPMSSPPGDPTL